MRNCKKTGVSLIFLSIFFCTTLISGELTKEERVKFIGLSNVYFDDGVRYYHAGQYEKALSYFSRCNELDTILWEELYSKRDYARMSLWKVDDTATQMLMESFYEGLSCGLSKYDALKKAQNNVKNFVEGEKQPYSDPKFWAGFILLDGIR